MSHVRAQIRAALAAALAGLATSGPRVYVARTEERLLQANELPCLLIWPRGETIEVAEPLGLGTPAVQQRVLGLTVSCVAAQNDTLIDTLDTMSVEVETALGESTLGGLVKELRYTGADPLIDAQAEIPAGRMDLRFDAIFMTMSNAPETAI